MGDDFTQLKLELKNWEKDFKAKHGHAPGRADIKQNPLMAEKYKIYSRSRTDIPRSDASSSKRVVSETQAVSVIYPQTPPRKSTRGLKRTASTAAISDKAKSQSANNGIVLKAQASIPPPASPDRTLPDQSTSTVYQSPIKSSPSKRTVVMSPFSRAQKRMAGEHVPPTPMKSGKKSRSRQFFSAIISDPSVTGNAMKKTDSDSDITTPQLPLESDTEIDDTIAPTPVKSSKVFRPIFYPNSPLKKQKISNVKPKSEAKSGPRWDKISQANLETVIMKENEKQASQSQNEILRESIASNTAIVKPHRPQTLTPIAPIPGETSSNTLHNDAKATKTAKKITSRSKPNFATAKSFTHTQQEEEEFIDISSDENGTYPHTSSRLRILSQIGAHPKRDILRVSVPKQLQGESENLDISSEEIALEFSDGFEQPELLRSLHYDAKGTYEKEPTESPLDLSKDIPSALMNVLSLNSPVKQRSSLVKRDQSIIRSLFLPHGTDALASISVAAEIKQSRTTSKKNKSKGKQAGKPEEASADKEIEADPFACMRLAMTAEDVDTAAEADSELWNGEGQEDDDWADSAVGWGEEAEDRLDASYV